MKQAWQLQAEWSSLMTRRMLRANKRSVAGAIREDIRAIELAAMADCYFPIEELRRARSLLVVIETWLQGGARTA